MGDENHNDAPLLIWTWSEEQLCKIAGSENRHAIVAGFQISPEKLSRLIAGGNYTLAAETLGDPSKAKAGYIYFPKENPFTGERKEDRSALETKIHELEKRGAELAETNAELERFAYIASHDLQEPLRMVSSFLQLLQKKYYDRLDEKANQYIRYAVDGAERMKALILDLLEYSRVGSGKAEFTAVDMSEVMKGVCDIFREKTIVSRAQIDIGSLPTVNGDKVQLTQLMQNLISNALKYHGEAPPHIQVMAEELDRGWRFSVKDNGIGIDPQFFDKIFIIFQRLHNKSDYSGTGIGLAICKKIVERHGGKIWVESASGVGSTFYFTIPTKS